MIGGIFRFLCLFHPPQTHYQNSPCSCYSGISIGYITVVIHILDVINVSQLYGYVYNATFVTMHKGEGCAQNQRSYRCRES